jgi:hypothetical protein
MRRHSLGAISVAALLIPGLARADSDAGFELALVFGALYGCVYYVILCLFSIPLSLLLRGSKFKRIGIGLVVPLIGIGLGALIAYWFELKHYLYYANLDQATVFLVISNIPMGLLIIWALVSRARAEAFERSRVQYAEYLEREKSLAKLVEANSRRANDT